MRKVSYLSYNMTTADANNPDMVHDYVIYAAHEKTLMERYEKNKEKVQREIMKLLPFLDLRGQWSIDVMQNVGDMMEYKATLTHIGNTSRDCRIEVFKLATPAYRAGKEDYKPGDMVWFDEPVLCTEGNVRLVVKKHLQRGEQPDGAVIDPWRHLDDFPEDE